MWRGRQLLLQLEFLLRCFPLSILVAVVVAPNLAQLKVKNSASPSVEMIFSVTLFGVGGLFEELI